MFILHWLQKAIKMHLKKQNLGYKSIHHNQWPTIRPRWEALFCSFLSGILIWVHSEQRFHMLQVHLNRSHDNCSYLRICLDKLKFWHDSTLYGLRIACVYSQWYLMPVSNQTTVQSLYNTPRYNMDWISLSHIVAPKFFYHSILQRNLKKLTLKCSFSYNSFEKLFLYNTIHLLQGPIWTLKCNNIMGLHCMFWRI